MWWNGRLALWMCTRQICSNCVMLSCQYGTKSLRNVSNTLCWIKAEHEELRQSFKGSNPVLARCNKVASECILYSFFKRVFKVFSSLLFSCICTWHVLCKHARYTAGLSHDPITQPCCAVFIFVWSTQSLNRIMHSVFAVGDNILSFRFMC